jgi:peroxin-16
MASSIQLSQFNKYTKFLYQRPTFYVVLTLVRECQVLFEMMYVKLLNKDAFKLIFTLESLKALIKLHLFESNAHRMMLSPAIYSLEPLAMDPSLNDPPKTWKGKRTGVVRPFSKAIEPLGLDYIVSRAVTHPHVSDMVPRLKGVLRWTEYAYIIRPLIYLFCLKKYGPKSWKPWTVSFLIELGCCQIQERNQHQTRLTIDEVKRRKRSLLYYLLKAPLYDVITK